MTSTAFWLSNLFNTLNMQQVFGKISTVAFCSGFLVATMRDMHRLNVPFY